VRTLNIHAEEFCFKALQKAIDDAEEVSEERRGASFRNALVIFVTVEEGDDKGLDKISNEFLEDVKELLPKLKADVVVLYPYAHLSPNLAPPHVALKVLKHLEKILKDNGINVYRAPFGWYKSFMIKCYGHPLSELSREFKPGELVRRVQITKEFLVVTPEGKVFKPEEFLKISKDEELNILIEKEALKKELKGGKGRASDYIRKFGFEWEPMSDSGHMRYEPHATILMDAVAEYSWKLAKSLGIPVFRVRGTNMFNLKLKPVREHAELFGDRLYEIDMDGDRFVLRYAACHQQFALVKDWVLSYKDLPFGLLEIADSYRYEQKGEIVLLFRMRKFHMPDLHIFTKDLNEALKVIYKVQEVIFNEIRKLGRSYVSIYNVTHRFFKDYFDIIVELIRREGRPALITLYPDDIYYWVLNVEYNIIDELKRPREIATFQIDIGNAKRFGIKYLDEKGDERYPVIIHTALIGSIERYLYAVFDTAALMEREGKCPTIPLWLAPIQVRIIPVKKGHMEYSMKVLEELLRNNIRADIDDRDLSLGKRIREAGIEWVPYIVVIGDREVKTGTINVRFRGKGMQKSMRLEEFIKMINKELEGYPRVDLTLPHRVSQRPSLPYLREVRAAEGPT